jgi:hypothetical protein
VLNLLRFGLFDLGVWDCPGGRRCPWHHATSTVTRSKKKHDRNYFPSDTRIKIRSENCTPWNNTICEANPCHTRNTPISEAKHCHALISTIPVAKRRHTKNSPFCSFSMLFLCSTKERRREKEKKHADSM